MARPWQTLETVQTDEGPLELRQRGASDFLIVVDGRVLMSSTAHRSELDVATAACARLERPDPNVLIGGLGMGFTLRAALDALGENARVVVAELTPVVVDWCRGPLAALTDDALADPRASVEVADVAELIRNTPRTRPRPWDAIILDLYEGPHEAAAAQRRDDPFYGPAALAATRRALTDDGVFSVWSEEPDHPFERRLQRAGFRFELRRPGKGGRRHAVYVATPGKSDKLGRGVASITETDTRRPRKRSRR